ncbi:MULTISPECIES: DUF4919 domain-containing protein [Microbulbifer]|uniref:DUF4919 domain-containing protein n=1 Tax=Microbulbifer celer TaxID=435905 RepID=A0ABW3UE36_9GAMM|nr:MULTISPECIES: DUF4919 domain-containing protein [Microbulbifer]UFN59041.1 DUF4919 domain-containing protein [Microbulbifer celer]
MLLVTAALLAACAGQQSTPAPDTVVQKAPQSEYRRLLAEAFALSFTLDFDRLRAAYVASPEYNPRGGMEVAGLPEAYQSVQEGDFDRCLGHLDKVLEENYMSLEAHMIGIVCSSREGHFDREDSHRYMVEGLMASIERSGDGRTQESAFRTISSSELRGFVRLKGLQVLDQSVVYDDHGVYDKMQVRDPESGDEYALFFNVSQQFASEVSAQRDN